MARSLSHEKPKVYMKEHGNIKTKGNRERGLLQLEMLETEMGGEGGVEGDLRRMKFLICTGTSSPQ